MNSLKYIYILRRIFMQAMHCRNIRPHYDNNLRTLQEISPQLLAPHSFMLYVALTTNYMKL